MTKVRNTVKKVLSIALVAMMSVSLASCNFFFGNSGTASSSSSSSKKPGGITISGDSSSIGIVNKNEFNINDFLTYPTVLTEDTTDYSTKSGYDIIIQAGQSNAEGSGYGETDNPFQPTDDILYYADSYQATNTILDGNFKVMQAAEKSTVAGPRGDFSLSFATDYLYSEFFYANTGRKILIIRAGVGGTGFSDKRWTLDGDWYQRMMAAIDSALKLEYGDNAHRLVAFLWHQGETDAMNGMSENTYYNHLSTLLTSVRTTYNCPTLPFLCADFVQDWRSTMSTASDRINAASKRVCEDFAPGAYLTTYGLPSNKQDPTHPDVDTIPTDNIHFCRNSLNLLGQKYFAAYKALLTECKKQAQQAE